MDSDDAYVDSVCRQFDLNEVVVTGTRTPKFLKDTPIQTRVINAKELARLDATNVQDLLQQELPGVEFSYAMNQQTHLNFSGFGGQGVLFLVDGERLAGETMDDVDFTRLNMDNVERIEIVKGAASALYGSNATGVENVEYKDYYDVSKGTISVEYPAYTLWKLSLVQRIGKAVKVNAALDNLFGYKPKFYYLNSPITDGVTFQIGVSIDIDKFF